MRYATLILIILLPTVIAPSFGSWTTSASAPASFRPNRTVAFTYRVTSTSATDLPIDWNVHLWTCTDSNIDNQCTAADARLVDWTEKRLQANGGASATITWSITLPTPEAAQLAYFVPRCTQTPCTGPAPTTDTKAILFQLHYTNTWSRTLTTPALAQNNTTGVVTYKLQSTSADDQDLAGTVELLSTPNGSTERSEGPRAISVLSNAQQTLTWNNVTFAPYGRQQERLTDSSSPTLAFANTSVLDVHLHVIQPAALIPSGGLASLYLMLEGHGTSPDPVALASQVRVILRNGTFTLLNTTLLTDANGTAYLSFQGAQDLTNVSWTVNASLVWNGFAFTPTASGNLTFQPTSGTDPRLLENVTAIRQSLNDTALRGVHLDELGTHNLLLEIGRVALIASLIAAIMIIIVIVSFRV